MLARKSESGVKSSARAAHAASTVAWFQGDRAVPFRSFWLVSGGGHTAEGDAGVSDHAVVDAQVKGGADRGNIIVQALGHLVGAELLYGTGARHDDLLDELAFLARGDPVIDEVIFQGQGAAGFAFAQHDLRAQGDQQRWRVADGRGIADVATQGALVADLQRGEALQQFAEVRVLGLEAS